MITETSTKAKVLAATGEAVDKIAGLARPLTEKQFNEIPYADSWTAGQLMNHVTKALSGQGGGIGADVKPADRDPSQRIGELKSTFLDFSKKMKSPAVVAPEGGPFDKQDSLNKMAQAYERLKQNTANADLNGLLEGGAIGQITKLEMLHFALYHAQRHAEQMGRIARALQQS